MSEINNYDPNPYDDVTIDEALAQIYDRVNDRTIRQMVTLLKNTAGDTSRYTIEKATAESGEVTYTLMQQISGGTPTPVGDIVSLRGSQILANYAGELQILDNIISIIKAALDGKADTTDIPTVPIMTIQKNGTGITPVDGTVNITVPVVAADVAALPDNTRYAAALSLTIDSATFVMTGQLKDQNGDNLGTAQTIDLPLESVVVGGSYNSQTQKVVLTLQNGNTIEFSVADLVYGLQTELSETNKLNPAYINYDNTHRAVSDAEKSEWNGKQDAIDSSHKLLADLVDDTGATNKFATEEELEQIETNKNNILSDNIISTSFTWGNGYISTGGHIFTSSQSYFSQPFTLHAGEKIVVRTKNKNICIIGSTTADSVVVGDNISILRTTSDVDQEETYDYTATEDIKIVICVLASNYVAYVSNHNTDLLLGSYATAAIKRLESRVTAHKNNISLISENNVTKNYFDYYNATIVNTYITSFVNNNDGTFTLKSNNATSGVVVPFISITLKAGQYVLSGCPPTGSDSTYRLDIRSNLGDVIDNSKDYGSGSSTFTIESDGLYRLGFRFASGYTFPADGLTFKPMICTPEQWATTHDYQPYIMNNAEITAMLRLNQ